jgi:hypothetical protein
MRMILNLINANLKNPYLLCFLCSRDLTPSPVLFEFGNNEHTVVFAGPSLHSGAERWWVTLSYGYQIYGSGIDEPADGKTFAEEVRNEIRLKVGLNF